MNSVGEFELVPLDCPSCGESLQAEGLDVVFYCTACRNGYRFDGVLGRLESIEVEFLIRTDIADPTYKPFWVLPVDIEVPFRDADSEIFQGLLEFLVGPSHSGRGAVSSELAVPAFRVGISRAVELCRRYSAELPQSRTKLGEKLTGGIFDVEDARKIAHHAILVGEVEKPGVLRDIEIRAQFGTPRLLGVPFVEQGGSIKDAYFHLVL